MQLDVEVSPPANALMTCNLQTNKQYRMTQKCAMMITDNC